VEEILQSNDMNNRWANAVLHDKHLASSKSGSSQKTAGQKNSTRLPIMLFIQFG